MFVSFLVDLCYEKSGRPYIFLQYGFMPSEQIEFLLRSNVPVIACCNSWFVSCPQAAYAQVLR